MAHFCITPKLSYIRMFHCDYIFDSGLSIQHSSISFSITLFALGSNHIRGRQV